MQTFSTSSRSTYYAISYYPISFRPNIILYCLTHLSHIPPSFHPLLTILQKIDLTDLGQDELFVFFCNIYNIIFGKRYLQYWYSILLFLWIFIFYFLFFIFIFIFIFIVWKWGELPLIYSDHNLSDVSYLCCVHSTVHATVLYSSRSRRSSLTKLSDRVTFLRTTKYCVAGMLFSLFDVSLRSCVCVCLCVCSIAPWDIFWYQ